MEKLSTIIKSKYGSINEARSVLGSADKIQTLFCDFQEKLYSKEVA